MHHEQKKRIADYFTTSELVELLDIDTYDLICAIIEFSDTIIDDETLVDLEEIMGIEKDDDA